ncbi:MAG: hypothetical protein QJR08_09550 [Bacillota bacterium]|nr:hypothetical protein [Bacillota bacterium]
MRLTPRRLELLRSVAELYVRSRLPVHYEALARRLGISKWTAYETLKQLETLGLVLREYGREEGRHGRPPVLFRPSEAARRLLGLPGEAAPAPSSPAAALASPEGRAERLEELFARWVGAEEPVDQLRELLAGLASSREPLEAAVRTLAAALLLLRLVDLDVGELVAASRRLVLPQARLAFALGAASALLAGRARRLRSGLRRPLEEALGSLADRLDQLAPGDVHCLSRLLEAVPPRAT